MNGEGKAWVTAELALLYVALPLVVLLCWSNALFLLIPMMIALALYCALRMRGAPREKEAAAPERRRYGRWVILRFLVGGALLGLLVFWLKPEWFLRLPRQRPGLWLMIMVLYPFLSALPQEIIYRVYFLHRWRMVWPGTPQLLLLILNALLFGFAHVILRNPWAPALTFLGGLLFMRTYLRTGSLFWATLEHALWGNLIFTLGLGALFHGGTVAQMMRATP